MSNLSKYLKRNALLNNAVKDIESWIEPGNRAGEEIGFSHFDTNHRENYETDEYKAWKLEFSEPLEVGTRDFQDRAGEPFGAGAISTVIDKRTLKYYPGFWKKRTVRHIGSDSRMIVREESELPGMLYLLDMLMDIGKKSLFTKPRFGLMMGVSISWSVAQKARQYSAEKKALETCKKKQLDGIYKRSMAVLSAFR